MAGINRVFILGNIGKVPEIKTTESGNKVANFSLAVTESFKNKKGETQKTTEWFNVVFWGKAADVIEKYLTKGSQVAIEGKIKTRSYENKEGVKIYVTEVLGENLTMIGGKPKEGTPETTVSVSTEETEGLDGLPF